jgi:hypothetical protein
VSASTQLLPGSTPEDARVLTISTSMMCDLINNGAELEKRPSS